MLTAARRTTGAEGDPVAPVPEQVTGVVLCGGRSRRMGADKALLEVDGRRLLDVALDALRPLAGRLVLACGEEPRYADLGLETVLDPIADGGPLAGLLAGLEACRTEWVVALACDMPRARSEVVERLLAHAARDELDVCLLETERGTQPLFGVYRRACLPAVRAALEAGERRMVSFHGSLTVGALRVEADGVALNVNTPDELDRLRGEAR